MIAVVTVAEEQAELWEGGGYPYSVSLIGHDGTESEFTGRAETQLRAWAKAILVLALETVGPAVPELWGLMERWSDDTP